MKKAVSLVEILFGMTLMVTLGIMTINTLKNSLVNDSDVLKFKHVYGTIAEVVFQLKNDVIMYPNAKGFANITDESYQGDTKVYGGEEKFKKLFRSKFNVLKNIDITFDEDIPTTIAGDESKPVYNYTKKINCFMENKGIVFCPPKTSGDLISMYMPVYINKVDEKNPASTSLKKAIFVKINKNGKIDIPMIVEYKNQHTGVDVKIIDCTDINFNSYNHCEVINKILKMDG